MQLRTVSSTPVVQLAILAVDLAILAGNNIVTGVTHLAAVGQLYARAPRAYRVAMVVGASLKVAEHAGRGIAADACDEICHEPWAIPQFFHHVEPLKLLVLQPGGGDPP